MSAENKAITAKYLRYLLPTTLFFGGGAAYYSLELLWRGYSHWSMAICGGLCLCAVVYLDRRLYGRPLYLRAAAGAAVITVIEFITGVIVNLWLGMAVWDYSELPLNLLGQICPLFTLIWFIICLPVCFITTFLRTRIARSSIADKPA